MAKFLKKEHKIDVNSSHKKGILVSIPCTASDIYDV